MCNLTEETYKIGHSFISDNKYVLEVLQSKNLSYFIEKMLEVSHSNISSLNMSSVIENVKIMNNTFHNLTVCKDTY